MIKFIYYFGKSIKTCVSFFIFKGLTYAYLVKTSMTHNKYSKSWFLEDSDPISAKSDM